MPVDRKWSLFWARLILVVASPLVFLLFSETVIRLTGIETDLARNKNFEIQVPVWLLSDASWVDSEQRRLETPKGVRAEDVAWLQYFEETRFIEYKMKPSVDIQAVDPFSEQEVAAGRTFHLASNSDGFRDREFAPATPAKVRIVSLGDSSTFGWGVDPEYTYQRLLENRLNARGPNQFEVLNLGMPGHTSAHGVRVLDHYALPLEPDVLILSFGANDARYEPEPVGVKLGRDETTLGAAKFALLRFETFKLLRRGIFSVYDPFASVAADRKAGTRPQLVRAVPRPDYEINLRRMIAAGREAGIPSVLIALCTVPEYIRMMQYVADTEGMPMVNGLQIFEDKMLDVRDGRLYPEERAYYVPVYGEDTLRDNLRYNVTSDGCHPNRVGHNLLADALADAVVRALSSRRIG
jgi:lysophospholipase L1-like esterase